MPVLQKPNASFRFVDAARRTAEIALTLVGLEPMLDLNYLYHRYGVSLHMADIAACFPSRVAHLKLADGYADQIALAKAEVARRW